MVNVPKSRNSGVDVLIITLHDSVKHGKILPDKTVQCNVTFRNATTLKNEVKIWNAADQFPLVLVMIARIALTNIVVLGSPR